MDEQHQTPENLHPWVAAEGLGDPLLTNLLELQDGVYKEVEESGSSARTYENRESAAAMEALRRAIHDRQKKLGVNPVETNYFDGR